jgi:hypothetical protein
VRSQHNRSEKPNIIAFTCFNMASKDYNQKGTGAKLLWPIVGMAVVLVLAIALKSSHRTGSPVAAGRISETPMAEVATEIDRAPVADTRAALVNGPGGSVSQPRQPASNSETNLPPNQLEARAAELMQLAMNDDDASLQTILKELRNPNRAIRDAAVQAAIQFGSREAIPSLNEAAQVTEDDSEKKQLLAAVEFLKLPSLTEVMLKQRPPNASSSSVSSPSTTE